MASSKPKHVADVFSYNVDTGWSKSLCAPDDVL